MNIHLHHLAFSKVYSARNTHDSMGLLDTPAEVLALLHGNDMSSVNVSDHG